MMSSQKDILKLIDEELNRIRSDMDAFDLIMYRIGLQKARIIVCLVFGGEK